MIVTIPSFDQGLVTNTMIGYGLKVIFTVQKRIRRTAKKTPQPTRLGPISFISIVLNPLVPSPSPRKVMRSPREIMARPTYKITSALPPPSIARGESSEGGNIA